MIKNEREYRITRSQASAFRKAIAVLKAEVGGDDNEKLAKQIQESALQSQLEELDEAVSQYEALLERKPLSIEANSIEELPEALIKARIASGLTQADLARQLSIPEQQIQRYEATDFSGASLKRISEVAGALKVKIQPYIFFAPNSKSLANLYRRVGAIGLTRDFIERWVLPSTMMASAGGGSDFDVSLVAARIGRIFGWDERALLGDSALTLKTESFEGVRYKKPKRANEHKTAVVTVYAHYLALLTLQCTSHIKIRNLPQDPSEIFKEVCRSQGAFGYEQALRYVWDLGVPVLPLRAEGGLHGAMWRVNKRNVVVLKQSATSTSRWLIDLLHEYAHSKDDPEQPSKAVIDVEDPLANKAASDEERKATEFAVETALCGRAEELFELCTKEANEKVEWLKKAVPRVAEREQIDVGVLANALAHRLSEQGINWWGTATKLQDNSKNPWEIARSIFFERVNLGALNPIDREILLQALSEE